MRHFLSYFILGIFLIALAFFAGAQKNPAQGLLGFLPFFVLGVSLFMEAFRKRPASFQDPTQALVYKAGLKMMHELEVHYRRDVSERQARPSTLGLLRTRLFGLNFAVSAMTLAMGSSGHLKSEKVYLALLEKAASGLRLPPEIVKKISTEVLQEQNRALQAEQNNVGSGQYALAALYEAALAESAATFKPSAESRNSFLGRRVGRSLADWAELYRKIAGRPAQTYTEGFSKSGKDFQGLPEE